MDRITPQGASAVTTVRILGSIVLVLAVVIQFLIGTLGEGGVGSDNSFQTLSLVFGVAAIGAGVFGLWQKVGPRIGEEHGFNLKSIMIGASIVLLMLAAAFGPVAGREFIESETVELTVLLFMLFKILVFAIVFLWYIELCHATVRFDELEQFVLAWRLEDFKVTSVVRRYWVWTGIIVPVVFGITFGVLAVSKGIIALAPPLISTSVEFNSIYGIVAITAVIFVPLAIILNFVFGWEGYQKATKRLLRAAEEEEEEEFEEFL